MIKEYNSLYDRLQKLRLLKIQTESLEMKQFIEDEIIFVKNKIERLEAKIRESHIQCDWTEYLEMLNRKC